ncbi:hypothetical protein EVAR_63215_1 [Eumeta japonica]|uniref:Mariner Mos1 transposase n=1 Tax=Eumeta variegata TaxID=151549 RepID=A0A4C1ZCT0_EUMVA|nr:hypothetical protein EVAR_63215_1 [Eumeta japonica]
MKNLRYRTLTEYRYEVTSSAIAFLPVSKNYGSLFSLYNLLFSSSVRSSHYEISCSYPRDRQALVTALVSERPPSRRTETFIEVTTKFHIPAHRNMSGVPAPARRQTNALCYYDGMRYFNGALSFYNFNNDFPKLAAPPFPRTISVYAAMWPKLNFSTLRPAGQSRRAPARPRRRPPPPTPPAPADAAGDEALRPGWTVSPAVEGRAVDAPAIKLTPAYREKTKRETATAEWYPNNYLSLVLEKVREERPCIRILFYYGDASPHTARPITNYFLMLGKETKAHPPYGPDVASCNFYFFPRIKEELGRKLFTNAEEAISA